MEDLGDIQFIQNFYVCDLCELRKGWIDTCQIENISEQKSDW